MTPITKLKTPVLAFLILLVMGLVVHLTVSWIWFLPLSLLVGLALRPSIPGALFWSGLLAGALVWGLGALFYGSGASTLPQNIAALFGLGSAAVLALVICLVGGLSGGLFMLLGAYLRATIQGNAAS